MQDLPTPEQRDARLGAAGLHAAEGGDDDQPVVFYHGSPMHEYLASVAPEELPLPMLDTLRSYGRRRSSSSEASPSESADTTGQPDVACKPKVGIKCSAYGTCMLQACTDSCCSRPAVFGTARMRSGSLSDLLPWPGTFATTWHTDSIYHPACSAHVTTYIVSKLFSRLVKLIFPCSRATETFLSLQALSDETCSRATATACINLVNHCKRE